MRNNKGQFIKGFTSWNKGKKYSRSNFRGINHFNWKGNNPNYSAIHKWIVRNYGSATFCSNDLFHVSSNYDWANISGKYNRDLSDWKQLCRKCHVNLDITEERRNKLANEDRKFRRPIAQYFNGVFVKKYDYILEAANKLKLDVSAICKVLKNKRNHTGGFSFKYL